MQHENKCTVHHGRSPKLLIWGDFGTNHRINIEIWTVYTLYVYTENTQALYQITFHWSQIRHFLMMGVPSLCRTVCPTPSEPTKLWPARSLRNHLWDNPNLGHDGPVESIKLEKGVPEKYSNGELRCNGYAATPKVCETFPPKKKLRHPWHLHNVSYRKSVPSVVWNWCSDSSGVRNLSRQI